RRKEEAMARLPQLTEISPWIVVDCHREVNPVLVILLDGFNKRGSAFERRVKNVSAQTRPQPYAISAPDLRASYLYSIDGSPLFEKLPFPFVHCLRFPSSRTLRIAP